MFRFFLTYYRTCVNRINSFYGYVNGDVMKNYQFKNMQQPRR